MIKAKFHVNKLEISDISKEKWYDFPTLSDVSAVTFSPHGKFIAVASETPKSVSASDGGVIPIKSPDGTGTGSHIHISLWDARAVIYPMMEFKNEDLGPNCGAIWSCEFIFWSLDSSYLGCIFQSENGANSIIAVYDVRCGRMVAKMSHRVPIHSATFTGIRPEVVLLCVQDSADTLVCDIAAETIATLGAGAPACPVTLQSAAHCSSDSYSGTAGSHIFSLSQSVSSDSTVRYAVSKWVVVDSALSVVATSEELLYPTAASGDVTNVTDSGCPHVNSLFTSFSPRVLLLHLTPAGGRSAKSDADSTNSQTDMSQGAWDTVLLLSKDTLAVVSRVSLFDLLSDSCMSRLGYRPNFSATSECSYHHVSCKRDITATVSSSLTLKVVPACSSSSVGGSAGGDSSVGAGAVESARLCAYMETTTTSVTTSYPLISMISDASAAAAAASVNSPPGPLTSPPMSPKALPLSAESNPVVPTTSHLGGTIRAEEEKLPVAERKEDSESMEVSSPPLSPIAAPTAGTDMVFPSRLGADVPLSTAVKVVREHHCFLFDAFVDGDGCSPVSQVAPVEGVAPVAVGDACRFENIIKLKCFTDLMATLRPLKGKGRECGAPVNLVPCPDPQRDRMLLLVLCSAGGTKGSEGGGNGVGKLLCCEDRITRSDFSGPSYPVGFTLIDKVQPYIETESELDTVVVKVTPGAAAAGVGGQGKRGQKRFARSSRHSERAPLGQVVIDLFNPAPKSACTHANKVLDVLPFDLRVFQSAKGVDKTAPDGTAAAAVASSGEQMATGTSESTYRGRGAEIRADGAENGCSSGTDHPNNPGRIMPLNFFFPLSSKFLQYKRSAEELLVTDAAHMASVDAATGGGGTGAVAADDAGVSADLTVGMDMGGVVAEGAEAGSGLGTDTAAASVLMKPTNYGALVHRCATSAEHVSSAMLKLQQEIVENKLKMAERLDKLKLAKELKGHHMAVSGRILDEFAAETCGEVLSEIFATGLTDLPLPLILETEMEPQSDDVPAQIAVDPVSLEQALLGLGTLQKQGDTDDANAFL